jgi:hypothetical protein
MTTCPTLPRAGQLFAFVASLTLFGATARAADVLVVRPSVSDPFVDEIFHRVGGELRLHAFSVRQDEAAAEDISLGDAQELLSRTGADACVSFISRGEVSVVRVWVAATGAAPRLFESVSLHRTPDVPTVLAARAVDLLIAALDEVRPRAAPATPAGAPTADLVAHVEEPAAPPSPWSLGIGSVALAGGSHFSAAVGPEVAAVRALSPRFAAGLRLAGPLWGARHAAADASADLIQGRALLHFSATLGAWRALSARLRAGVGAQYIHVAGRVAEGIASIRATTDGGWTVAGTAGLDVAVALSSRLAVGLGADAGILWPRPRIEVGRDTVRFDQFRPSLTLDVRFNL